MKKIYSILLITIFIFFVTGCINDTTTNKKDLIKLNVNCNDKEIFVVPVKKNTKFKCELIGEEYEFTVKEINKKEIKIKSNSYGLTTEKDNGTISLISKDDEFTIIKDKNLKVFTQTTDYNQTMTLNWN